MRRLARGALFLGTFLAWRGAGAFAQEGPAPSPSPPPERLDLPLLEAPFNTDQHAFPGMQQSLSATKDTYQLVHRGLAEAFAEHPLLARGAILGFDLLATWLPLGNGWLHEEWHRAVLSRRGVASYDDIYDLPLFQETVSVSHVRDPDLARLKREHPAEQVRLSAAGVEAEHELVLALEKDAFFFGSRAWNLGLLLSSKLNASAYVYLSGTADGDETTDRINAQDGADVTKRDFAGLDFTAWVYDLFRPEEPYDARGVHPSGVGIDRYRKTTHLTREELDFLRLQGLLTWLNFLDPQLAGFRGFVVGDPRDGGLRWTAGLRHELTSFGYAVDTNVFLKRSGLNLATTFHCFVNRSRAFPGIDVQALRLRTGPTRALWLTPRVALWLQPEGQSFRTRSGQAGGLVSLRVGWPVAARIEPWGEIEAKSAGWVAGSPYLDANVTARVGLAVVVF